MRMIVRRLQKLEHVLATTGRRPARGVSFISVPSAGLARLMLPVVRQSDPKDAWAYRQHRVYTQRLSAAECLAAR